MDKAKVSRELHEKLHRIEDFYDLERAVKEVVSSVDARKTLSVDTKESNACGPYGCMYCKHEHKLLNEQIKDLKNSNRKLATELKESEKAKFCREHHEKITRKPDFYNLETHVKEVVSSFDPRKESKACAPYDCMYCKHEQKLLHEQIQDLKNLNRKLAIEFKEMDKAKSKRELHEKLQRIPDFYDLETDRKIVASSIGSRKESKACGPYDCIYCIHESEHTICNERLKDLRSTNRRLATELKLLQSDIKEDKKIAQMNKEEARKAVLELSSENRNLRETLKTLEAKNTSLSEQLKLEKNRLRNMERFRRLEISGFQTDIKNLKTRIQDLEKQLTKAVLIFEHDKKDLELLKTIHSTAQHSKQATAAIRRLKAKLYELENDIKNL